jgi:hypothetical protein
VSRPRSMTEAASKRSIWRRIERWMVGLVMASIAFVLERMVLRGIRKKGEMLEPDPKTITSRGGEVRLDERDAR